MSESNESRMAGFIEGQGLILRGLQQFAGPDNTPYEFLQGIAEPGDDLLPPDDFNTGFKVAVSVVAQLVLDSSTQIALHALGIHAHTPEEIDAAQPIMSALAKFLGDRRAAGELFSEAEMQSEFERLIKENGLQF